MNQVNVYTLRFRGEVGEGVGNDVPYGREPRSPGVGNDVPPQQTALQPTVKQNNVVAGNGKNHRKPSGQIDYLVSEIEQVTQDTHSRPMFHILAEVLPDEVIFQLLAEIRQGDGIRNPGAIFVSAAKRRLQPRKS